MKTKALFLTIGAMTSLVALSACARAPGPASPAATTEATTEIPATETGPATPAPVAPAVDPALPLVVVHKNESCGCCGLWVEHLRTAGFQVEVRNVDNLDPVKSSLGVPVGKGSCHTAEIGGYFVEGHVPADDVKRLLAQKPDAKGLVLPGMPMGSPGMEMPDGRREPYTVELVGRDGTTTAFARH